MKQEKYGFIYIWRDRKHNRYYIGSHWGTEDDGYDCSSRWMRAAKKRRPQDFKRRVIEYVSDKQNLYDVEFKWLSMIKEEEIKVRYYNLRITKFNHWSAYPENILTIKEKISHGTKKAMQRPDVKQKLEEGYKKRDNKGSDPEIIEKRRKSMIKTMAKKFPVENRRKHLKRGSEVLQQIYADRSKEMWENRTTEERKEIGSKISKSLKGKKNRLGQSNSKEHRRKISEGLKGKIHSRHRISINDIEYSSTKEASLKLGISQSTLNRRLNDDKYQEYIRIGKI